MFDACCVRLTESGEHVAKNNFLIISWKQFACHISFHGLWHSACKAALRQMTPSLFDSHVVVLSLANCVALAGIECCSPRV